MVLLEFAVLTFNLIVFSFFYYKWQFFYWKRKNVPCVSPTIPFGNFDNPWTRKRHGGAALVTKYYHYFKSLGHKYGGLYLSLKPILLLVDLELIKNVMTKDFTHFTDRGLYYNKKGNTIDGNPLALEWRVWRTLRTSLTPSFTTGKMKILFSVLLECGDHLEGAMNQYCHKRTPVDIKDALERFTIDVIGSSAFGVECNSFQNPENEFVKYCRMPFSARTKLLVIKNFVPFASLVLRRLGISVTDSRVQQFFLNVVSDTVKYRKQNKIVRNDFLQQLLDFKNEDGTANTLTIPEIAAQISLFFFAGYETASTTMTFCLLELAQNQEVQGKLRDEITRVLKKYNGQLTYDAVMEMTYLGAVIDETLRKYPAVPTVPRMCVKNYKLPGSNVVLEKGVRVIIPVYALHHNPEYFPDPEKFDPERFCGDNKSKIASFTYLPFGEGPRICIGLRFGLLQTKVGLIVLLRRFKFLLNSKTTLPIKFHPQHFILTAEGGIWLDVERHSD